MRVWAHVFSMIADIPPSTQGRLFIIYSPRHTFSIGHVGAAHSLCYAIPHRDIIIRRPAFKDTKPLSHGLFNSAYLIVQPQLYLPNRRVLFEPLQLQRPVSPAEFRRVILVWIERLEQLLATEGIIFESKYIHIYMQMLFMMKLQQASRVWGRMTEPRLILKHMSI
jgi:hypothetical protein